ncbi:LIM zinc-binding domain-containing protein, partial [Trichostrongylus colubriformis]
MTSNELSRPACQDIETGFELNCLILESYAVGPLKDGALFHKGCFKCWICGTRLSLKTYHNNRNDTQDLEVYCAGHVPTPGPHDPIPH